MTAEDYDQVGVLNSPTEGADRVAVSSLVNGSYNSITLNSTGRGWINKTGVTKLGLRNSRDVDNNEPPSINNQIAFFSADRIGTSQDPKLVVTYTLPAKQDVIWFD